MHPLLLQTAHRPIPMPSGPWSIKQTWHDLLFAHWPLKPEKVRAMVPRELDLDLRDGMAYVAVAPFWMSGIRGRLAPPLPFLYKFCELNVRTYVCCKGVPGVYFFSLDAASLPAVWGARAAYKLPYFHAAMLIRSAGESFEYTSSRLQMPRPANFHARYWPTATPRVREKESLEYFLTERYCLYTVDHGRVLRAYIHHAPWPLQDADAEFDINTMAQAAGIELPESKPLLHYSRVLEVLVWKPEKI
ncbi:MAG TPA: DUF2071 domain-containing protein [Candidatus Angelobacter sp.]|jgi:hypothetical protein|nr:DUF2071 domain-containing protein [Candidatus Angelobacter sp.]